ncbi:Nif3-like dinuclear metal center hexameric protein [Patiriisocius hiemis]|uniref:GTP cyclohydrolase 1 type 2 homolog n=1 Tax=Patiriisocius hiemis TaxID=3075604 RepID=A0ABU2YCN2_9FLAO|nr:Nif3-like dinuclear metal center hexameric protein [Constantimarinum sp. W242]MDT0555949.1 Nif3-like dinuclear metal center hexameric protein [Constantimarinum sp. W242]
MKIKDIIALLQDFAPLQYAEDFDNTGLLVGNANKEVSNILVTLDTLEEVVDEAIENNCNLIVSFHPIIFSGLKKITGNTYVERAVLKAIKNDIAIFAIHTALDNSFEGVNAKVAEKLQLQNTKILIPQKGTIKKLVAFVPNENLEEVRSSLFKIGAGAIGNYDNCSFTSEGHGTFKGNDNSNPVKGKKGNFEVQKETNLGITFHKHLERKVIETLLKSHPYEEVAYEITTLENTNQHIGMGMVGELQNELSEGKFLRFLKQTMKTECVRHSKFTDKPIKKVAVLGGSGAFAINAAKSAGADAFVSSDFKYHDFFKAENNILLADIGHYESEQFTKELLVDVLTKKITNFAPALSGGKVVLSQVNTNPISYF